MEFFRLKTTALLETKHQSMKNVVCSMWELLALNQIYALAIEERPLDSLLKQAWLTSLTPYISADIADLPSFTRGINYLASTSTHALSLRLHPHGGDEA